MKNDLKTYPLVSIITVNYNQSKVTLDLLQTSRDLNYPNFEIIVVDNGSPSDNPEVLKEAYPEINLIISKENLGFAGGNNLGIKAAKGEYLFFVNNDTEVTPGLIEPLVELLEQDKTIGMVSPKIKFHWNKELIQYAGYTKMNPYTIRNSTIGFHQKDNGQLNDIVETEAGHGAAMMVPRSVVEKVGLMPDVYFLYYEEHDWAAMIKRAGYKIFYQPKAEIFHKESISTGKGSPFKTYYLNRGRILFTRRNIRGSQRFLSLLFQHCISLPKNALVFMVKGQFKHLMAYLKAYVWNLTHYKGIYTNPKF